MKKRWLIFLLVFNGMIAAQEEAPIGAAVSPTKAEAERLKAITGAIKGHIVWSSSRSNGKHDIWIMNADGTGERQLTKGGQVDWYPRFSPDGKKVLFTRSKYGWVSEADAEIFDKWDIWTIGIDGREERKVADNGTWGTWRPSGDSIVFARGPKVFIKDLKGGGEREIFDASLNLKKGSYSQQPQLSSDGNRLAVTIRGTRRETGIWNIKTSIWYPTGGGCQMEWFPDGKRILRMNEGQGNGGTEILAVNIDEDGRPTDRISGLLVPKNIRFMDLPGRRSHEYFPKLDPSGKYLVWCATQYGHEHDIADYEVYLWRIGEDPVKGPVRLTFHSGNDRWPDIFIYGSQADPAKSSSEAILPPSDFGATVDTAGAENSQRTPASRTEQ